MIRYLQYICHCWKLYYVYSMNILFGIDDVPGIYLLYDHVGDKLLQNVTIWSYTLVITYMRTSSGFKENRYPGSDICFSWILNRFACDAYPNHMSDFLKMSWIFSRCHENHGICLRHGHILYLYWDIIGIMHRYPWPCLDKHWISHGYLLFLKDI